MVNALILSVLTTMKNSLIPYQLPVACCGRHHVQAATRNLLLVTAVFLTLDRLTHSGADSFKEYVTGTDNLTTVTLDPLVNHTDYGGLSNSISVETTDNEMKRGITHRENLLEMRRTCPGAAEYLSKKAESAIFRISASKCHHHAKMNHPRSLQGVVLGVCNDSTTTTTFCQFRVQVDHGLIVRARVKRLFPACTHNGFTYLANRWPPPRFLQRGIVLLRCTSIVQTAVYMSSSNHMYVSHYNIPMLQLTLEAVPDAYRLNISPTSNMSGYVTPLAPEGISLERVGIRGTLKVPEGHSVMISFEIFRVHHECFRNVVLRWNKDRLTAVQKKSFTIDDERVILNFHTSQVEIQVNMNNKINRDLDKSCMKMLFSFHPEHRVPQRLSSGLYNCSVEDYWRFQQHLDCNLKVECEDGRDEAGHCPFSSPACDGWVATQHKCYKRLTFKKLIDPTQAIDECLRHGWKAASIKTNRELTDFENLFQGRSHVQPFIGLLRRVKGVPFMYRHFYVWADNTVLYSTKYIILKRRSHQRSPFYKYLKCDCPVCDCLKYRMVVVAVNNLIKYAICEKSVQREDQFHNQSLTFPETQILSQAFIHRRQALTVCSDGHVTHSFLICDLKSLCGQTVCSFLAGATNGGATNLSEVVSTAQTSASTMTMFPCSKDGIMIPYTLVCDFRHDCLDQGDELFCKHSSCAAFTCDNGQCVASVKRCNGFPDCLDESDENDCPASDVRENQTPQLQHKLVINIDGKGYFTQHLLNSSDPCPETHYSCRADLTYCLPIYTRCNDYYDCVFHEDERYCETMKCSGLYRCRNSTVCLHSDHLCDGLFQCPQRDDEWLCDMTCPAQCLCQGHAFLCPQPFSAHLFPQLRYLDARGSGMTPSDLKDTLNYIIYLNLAECSVTALPDMKFPNLQSIDLSNNRIATFDTKIFLRLENLKVLSLQGNPLTSVISKSTQLQNNALQRLDVSGTYLSVFDKHIVRNFPGLQYINVSFSPLVFIQPGFFQSIPDLQELDIRRNMIDTFSLDVFVGLYKLRLVRSTDYRLCCKNVLPNISPQTKCISPPHFLSSCEYMIRSEVYVLSLWCVAIVASLGNLACSVGYYVVRTVLYKNTIIIFMVSLQCANFCMGIYSGVIATAQETFHAEYIHQEGSWKESVACKVAGFLSVLSNEVSILIILLLTLDHLTVLCFPLSNCRFNARSAVVACGVTWVIGMMLASVPLVPGLSHWGHYGQTALCCLMLNDRLHIRRGVGFFHTILILNCFVCFVMGVVQVFVYRAMPKYRVLVESNKNPAHVSVDLMLRIAVTDILAWVSVAITSLLALADEAVSKNTQVFMTLVVLPLNSAINPLLCLWHALSYKQRQKQEERILHILKSKMNR